MTVLDIDGTVNAFTLDGRMVASAIANGDVDINLPAGLYIVEIKDDNAVRTVVKICVK